jgi:hypothetical protein
LGLAVWSVNPAAQQIGLAVSRDALDEKHCGLPSIGYGSISQLDLSLDRAWCPSLSGDIGCHLGWERLVEIRSAFVLK